MENDLRTDSADYRTELLSPEALGENTVQTSQSSWRINFDECRLPQNQMNSDFGVHNLVKTLRKQKKVAEYYKRQEKLLQGFNEVDSYNEMGVLPGALTEEEEKNLAKGERIAIQASNIANVVLFIAKLYASVESRSLAVIASTLDSLLDLLSGFILWFTSWARTVLENVWSLIGRAAPPEYLAKLTYLIWNHHEKINHIDTVRAYTFGGHYFVEADIVLPERMPLAEAHNIGETLQEKIEEQPEVERAFVHVDFECTHQPEHKSKAAAR